RYASAASRRRLRSRRSTAISSSLPALASCWSALATIRSAPTRSRSPARIAVRTSAWTCSRTLIELRAHLTVKGIHALDLTERHLQKAAAELAERCDVAGAEKAVPALAEIGGLEAARREQPLRRRCN